MQLSLQKSSAVNQKLWFGPFGRPGSTSVSHCLAGVCDEVEVTVGLLIVEQEVNH